MTVNYKESQNNHNQDASEIQKFNDHAEKWWDTTDSTSNPFFQLHKINPLRLAFIQKHIDLKNKFVLDVGCGGGILSEGLAMNGALVEGIDASEKAIEAACLHALHHHQPPLAIQYHTTTIENFACTRLEASPCLLFDAITCMEMLEHVPSPEAIIKTCAALLKGGGHLFLSTLNRNLKAYLYAIIAAEWVLNLLPRGTHDYSKFIRPSELCQVLRETGFEVKTLAGLTYAPLRKCYTLTDDISVNYFIYAQKI